MAETTPPIVVVPFNVSDCPSLMTICIVLPLPFPIDPKVDVELETVIVPVGVNPFKSIPAILVALLILMLSPRCSNNIESPDKNVAVVFAPYFHDPVEV